MTITNMQIVKIRGTVRTVRVLGAGTRFTKEKVTLTSPEKRE